MLAWHFLRDDECLQYGRRSKVRVGQTLRRDPEKLMLCNYGLHASVLPIDALQYAPGPVICRVRLGGTILEEGDKAVASRRTVLWMRNIERELRLFACWSVRHTPLYDGRVVWDLLTDRRSQAAVEVAEQYADGLATTDELAAARSAVMKAAWDGARAVVMEAAWAAARAAARNAAMEAAWAAARAAESDAESDAAWAAAKAAAMDAQNEQLKAVLAALEGGE